MFDPTITLTIATVPKVLVRVNQDSYGSAYEYAGATDSISMKIRHSTDKVDSDGISMKRHNVYIERIVFATPTALMQKESVTYTIRGGKFESPALTSDLGSAAVVWLAAPIVVRLATGEN